MSSVSIIRSDHPESPDDIGIVRGKLQEKRTDPEADILREFLNIKESHNNFKYDDRLNELIIEYSEKLDVTPKELLHKIEIFYGICEDDECEWREEKYGKH